VEHQAKPSGVGAVAGALIGGVIGNRFGGGNGRALMTVGGAVGGGVAGNEIEKHAHTTTSYVIDVRMENGKLRHFNSAAQPGWHAGDQVKVVDGKLAARA
jgi:outer membrane lipoprotein SlyB